MRRDYNKQQLSSIQDVQLEIIMCSRFRLTTLIGIIVFIQNPFACGQDRVPQREISYDDLAMVGENIAKWQAFQDNEFLHSEHRGKILESAKPLVGSNVTFSVLVERITTREVFLNVPHARNTRISLRHATAPEYGNLGSVEYYGPKSARLAHILSKKFSLRIGSEIDLDVAKGLRSGDLLRMKGRVETIHVLLDRFQPRAIAVISNFDVTGVNPDSENRFAGYRTRQAAP